MIYKISGQVQKVCNQASKLYMNREVLDFRSIDYPLYSVSLVETFSDYVTIRYMPHEGDYFFDFNFLIDCENYSCKNLNISVMKKRRFWGPKTVLTLVYVGNYPDLGIKTEDLPFSEVENFLSKVCKNRDKNLVDFIKSIRA